MSTESTKGGTRSRATSRIPEGTPSNWRYVLGAGVVISVLGVLAVLAPYVTGVGLSIVFGTLLVVAGLTNVAHAFSARGWRDSLYQVGLAVLYTAVGIALLVNPSFGLTTLTLLLLVYFVFEGLVKLVMGVRIRTEPQWVFYVLSGVVSFVLAVLVYLGYPSTSFQSLGLLFGLNLLSTGVALILAGNRVRKATGGSDTGTLGV